MDKICHKGTHKMRYNMFKQYLGGGMCRRCLNRTLRIRLRRQDCVYHPYEQLCPVCGDMRHICHGRAVFQRPQLWKAKAVKAPAEPSRSGRNSAAEIILWKKRKFPVESRIFVVY